MVQQDTPHLDFSKLNHDAIQSLLDEHRLQLTIHEAITIQCDILKRPPTLAECVLWSIQGSEHCSYKSSKTLLQTLPTEAPNLILGVGEDAGVVEVAKDHQGARYGIAISHESHNHPSQIVPFEGAATGVGGNVRDISCMGAEVIALADSLRFANPNQAKTQWLQHGVVDGIASYGNALGIPNIAGDVAYHDDYQGNCLVTVVTLGLVKEEDIIHSYVPAQANGHQLILVGKPTDNSGFGGASFASADLDETTANKGAVQEPNAFLERHLLKANQALFKKLKAMGKLNEVAFKDLGAGGIACSSVELADGAGFGCVVNLDVVPTALEDLSPTVILCAETQERFMWAVPKTLSPLILEHYNQDFDLPNVSSGAQAVVIGEITQRPQYVVRSEGQTIVDAPARAVTSGLTIERPIEYKNHNATDKSISKKSHQERLATLLNHTNIASAKNIYQHYDKQVQGRTIIERGDAQAGLIAPFNSDDYPPEIQKTGVALSVSHNPILSRYDATLGAQMAVLHAMEAVTSLGASPQALTDCLCFGNPENPYHMHDFSQSVQAIAQVANSYPLYEHPNHTIAIAAGNVSFYNNTESTAIPPSPMMSCLGRMSDHQLALRPSFCKSGSDVWLIRQSPASLNGSHLAYIEDCCDSEVFSLDIEQSIRQIHYILSAHQSGLIHACRAIHYGGLLVTLTLMSQYKQSRFQPDDHDALTLFGETGGFVFESAPDKEQPLRALAQQYQLDITHITTIC